MNKFTAKNYHIKKAPSLIQLLGDKTKKPEPAQHIIEFPGGAIEVSRTTEGNYWAHIIVNRKQAFGDEDGLVSTLGKVLDSRLSTDKEIVDIPHIDETYQIAVLIGRDNHV